MASIDADRHWRELGRIYREARARLEARIRVALERGAIGTAAYRQAQLQAVIAELARLQDIAVPVAAGAVEDSYRAGAHAADRALGGPAAAFSGVHRGAVEVLADNLVNRLNQAAVTVGRRTEDAFRRIALQEVAAGIAAGDARRDVSDALQARYVEDGVTDAITGFVDNGGRRWALDTYAEMVARTTTREAVSAGTANRLLEAGRKLITITEHEGSCQICIPYQGKTWALPGETVDGYETIDRLAPFHPNCRHVIAPARGNFEAFERELGLTAEDPAPGPVDPPPTPPATAADFAPQPFEAPKAEPSTGPDTDAHRRATEIVDSWSDPEEEEARRAWQDQEGDIIAALEKADAKAAEQAIADALGPDLMAILDDLSKSGVKWARDDDLKQALLSGDTTIEEIEELAEEELKAGDTRRRMRQQQEVENRGFNNARMPCFVCGRFKRRPADVCAHCGDEPGTYRGNADDLNAAYGYRREGSRTQDETVRGRGTLIQ